MKPFFIYRNNDKLEYSAETIFETDENLFLVESNNPINQQDIIKINENSYTISNNTFYVLIVLDKITGNIIANYGNCSYCHSLYYYQDTDSLFMNLSLKQLLKNINIQPTLNINAANQFINYGFINDNNCLINNIKRLSPLKKLIYKNNKVIITEDIPKYENNVTYNYAESLSKSLPDTDTKIILSLSGGFDSTFLAYLLKNHKNLIAFTVGSLTDPENEFNTAQNTGKYLGIKQCKISVTYQWIYWLPKIVEMFEGEMLDPGVFLCWAIVEEIKQLNLNDYTLIVGDGADQVLNINFYQADLNTLPKTTRHEAQFWPSFPKHCLYYLVVKKMEWILHENNISYKVPFLSNDFINCTKNTQTVRKEEYKTFIKQMLPQEITKLLDKKGGVIKGRYFVSEDYLQKFSDILKTPKYERWFKNKSLKFRLLLYKIYVIIFNYIYIEGKSIDMPFDNLLDILLKEGQNN